MRFPLFIIAVVSVSAFSEPIADFAPDQVGNIWEYHVNRSISSPTGGYYYNANFTRIFKIVNSEVIPTVPGYKRIIFDIIDSGIDTSVLFSHTTISAIDTNYFNTCYEFGDSIQDTTSPGVFSIDFIPFYKHHIINSDSSGMKKILYKNDSLFQFIEINIPHLYYSSYVQNIGLDSLDAYRGGNTSYYLSAKLISFTPSPTSIAQVPKKLQPIQTTRRNFPSAYIFDLQGRRFQYRSLSALPPGLMINRGVNYLQVK